MASEHRHRSQARCLAPVGALGHRSRAVRRAVLPQGRRQLPLVVPPVRGDAPGLVGAHEPPHGARAGPAHDRLQSGRRGALGRAWDLHGYAVAVGSARFAQASPGGARSSAGHSAIAQAAQLMDGTRPSHDSEAGECPRAVTRNTLSEMREQLVDRLGRRIAGGDLALLGSVNGAIAAVDALAGGPGEAEERARAVVTDMPGEPISLALYAGDRRGAVVQLEPQRAIAL